MKASIKKLAVGLVALTSFAANAAEGSKLNVVNGTHVQVRSVRLEPINAGINPRFRAMNVYATVVSGNSCMRPEHLVQTTELSDTKVTYQLIGVHDQRLACPMIYKPVFDEILVATFRGTDIMPVITVNGIVASTKSSASSSASELLEE